MENLNKNPNRIYLTISGSEKQIEPRDFFVERHHEIGFVKAGSTWIAWLNVVELKQLENYDRVNIPDYKTFKCFRLKFKKP